MGAEVTPLALETRSQHKASLHPHVAPDELAQCLGTSPSPCATFYTDLQERLINADPVGSGYLDGIAHRLSGAV